MALVAAVILSLTVAAYAVPPPQNAAARRVGADPSPSTPPAGCAQRVPPHRFGAVAANECVGYSDGEALVFGSGTALPEAQRRVFRYNADVERLPRGKNPRVRLVVLTALSTQDTGHPAEREALDALAVAQDEALAERAPDTRPFLQVVMANAGGEGRHLDALLPELARLARDDPTVLGVLVAMESRSSTRRAMRAMQELGLLVFTAAGAGERFRDGMTRYLQAQAPVRQQATLVRAYARAIGRPRLVDVHDPRQDDDLDAEELRHGLAEEFDGYAELRWDGGTDLSGLCADRSDAIVLYSGGHTAFGGFLRELRRRCDGRLPILVGAGGSARYLVGDPRGTGRAEAPEDYPFVFAGNGITGAACRPRNARQRAFLAAVARALGRCRDPNDPAPLGLRTGPTYDIVRIVLNAVAELAGGALTGAAIHARVLESGRRRPFEGVTGSVRFGTDGVPDSGGESLLCARNVRAAFTPGQVPTVIASTGAGGVARTGLGRCPLPRR